MKKFFVLFTVVLLFTSCQPSNEQRTVKLNIFTDPLSLDPSIGKDITSATVVGMLFEGLTRIDGEGNPAFAAARSVDVSPDKKTYTFFLRKTKWSNGERVTASHFVQAWRRLLSPDFPGSHAYHLFIIKGARAAKLEGAPPEEIGVRALDDYTLQVELNHPTPYFLSFVASTIYYPTYPGWNERENKFISNGPFRLHKWEHSKELLVKKNLHYWDANHVKIEGIEMVMVGDQMTELSMFEQGELDWAGAPFSNIPYAALDEARNIPGFHALPAASTYWYQFNSNRPPFHNEKMRKAFSAAINRKNIVDYVSRGSHEIATGLIPPNIKRGDAHFSLEEDPMQFFQEGLEELGITKEEFPPVAITYNTGEDHYIIAQAIQQEWKTIFGITVTLREAEWGVHIARLRSGDFQVAKSNWDAQFFDPTDFFNRFRFHTSLGHGAYIGDQWGRPHFADLLAAADYELDQGKREELLFEAEKYVLSRMPVAPIFHRTCNYLQSPALQGVVFSTLGRLDFRWAQFEE